MPSPAAATLGIGVRDQLVSMQGGVIALLAMAVAILVVQSLRPRSAS